MKKKDTEFLLIDIGSYALSIAECYYNGKCVTISKYVYKSYCDDELNTPTAVKVANGLEKALEDGNFHTKRCAVSIEGRPMFERTINLPPFTEEEQDRREQIIHFEARQNIPFPMDEVYVKYHTFKNWPDEVCIFAVIQRDSYFDYETALTSCGLEPFLITGCNWALLNGLNLCSPPNGTPKMLVDIGHRSTNLIFRDGHEKDVFMMRTIPIASASISMQTAKELGIDLRASNFLKNEVSDPDNVPNGERYQMAFKVTENVAKRIKGEINRSKSVFRSHMGGEVIDQFFAIGYGCSKTVRKNIVLNSMELGELSPPDGGYALSQYFHEHFPNNLVLLGLAEMATNDKAVMVDFCRFKSGSSIIQKSLRGFSKLMSLPFRLRVKFYLKEKKDAR